MVKKEKRKEKPTTESSDDGIDLQSLISSLKEKSGEKPEETSTAKDDKGATEEKTEAAFELVEEEKTEDRSAEIADIVRSEGDKKSKGSSDEEMKALEEERRKIVEERRQFEDEKNALLEEKRRLEEEKNMLEEERKGHHETRSKTEEDLKAIGTELLKRKDSISKMEEQVRKRDAEQREKEKNIKKATDLLLSQRQALADKEKTLEGLKEQLTKKAEELKVKEEKVATLKDKTAELDAREIRIRELEDKLKDRELHHKALEEQMASCPRCSSKERFLSLEDMMNELREFGIVDEQGPSDLKEMRSLMDQGQNEKAIELAERTFKRLKDLKDGILAKGILYLLAGTEKDLKHAKEVGGHGERVADAERWLAQAKDLIKVEEYKTAEFYIKEADYLLQTLTRGPPAAPPPSTVTPSPAESFTRNYSCPSCSTTFTVDTTERPVRITCPGCQIELIIKEDVSFA